eukprot:c5312_g1_i2 orf=369-1538(+)
MVRSDQDKIREKDFLGLHGGGDMASREASAHVYTINRACDAKKHSYMNNHMYIVDPHFASQHYADALAIMKSNIPDAVQWPTASQCLYSNNHHHNNLAFAAMRRPDWSNAAGRPQFLSFNDSQDQKHVERVNENYQQKHARGHENAVLGSTALDCSLVANSSTDHSGSGMKAFPFMAPIFHELAVTSKVEQIPGASGRGPAGQALTPDLPARNHWPPGVASPRMLPSDSCIKPSSAQLTIFYAGKVNVYNDVFLTKAQEIMRTAAAGDFLPPNMDMSSRKPASLLTPHVPRSHISADHPWESFQKDQHTCQPDQFGGDQVVISPLPVSIPRSPQAESSKPNNQNAFLENESVILQALPQARKASLARFLEKRKERVLSKSPYPAERTFL